ncbi:beta-ketoacyl synthase N-terminal-like domain-containing protein [Moorena sp. SIO3H5]|uniref:beta-ketoacyl synthase N-terminal-like domain-containing protein n=1 Tax=Moorena sp. SIO3H5 TaxID=2607834 RepID=UPI0013B9A54B|nr:beta-ketoacyl synthase N-terminal-like domain-containing protein [Moorena sp. SIO3H5]NEO68322.1 acyltransferase domain-containing protein [Moorena sp. SIO3H5]
MDKNISPDLETTENTTKSQDKWHSQLQQNPIAIVGMAALFPNARNLQEYWENILGKVDCITDVPSSHWNVEDYYDPDPKTPDKTYAKRGGFLPDVKFDPLEFGLPPDTLEAIDSAQLLGLMMAKTALADAGYDKSREFNRETTGVILGGSGLWKSITPLTTRLQYPVWEKVLKSTGFSDEDTQKIIEKIKLAYVSWEENSFPGMLTNVVAGRITNRLNLGGTNCTVDAACASSLSALKMSISELLEGRCDMMLTGGFDTDNSILNYMCFTKTPAFSKKDYLNPFDASSDGMMVGEGLGMLVIKRLEDAERDGDRIYAVIKGIGTSSDGRYKSIYAPRPEGQVKALRRAYKDAGFSPSTVSLMEAHGTGTPAGDFCEFTALNEVFSENNSNKQHIALGSVKSQIGHTKAAAGSASLIKTALALHQKILPPTINITQPNPKFNIDESPFYLNTDVQPWLRKGDNPRRAGVSSFGFGGTNFHIVLEEYTKAQPGPFRIHKTPGSILLSANTPEELLSRCEGVIAQLESETALEHYQELINSCKSLVVPVDAARVGFVATSLTEACNLLKLTIKMLQTQGQAESWEHPRGIYYRQTGIASEGKVVALFPGQGSQYLEMGKKLALNFPPVQDAYNALDDLFINDGLKPLSQVVFPYPGFENNQKAIQTEVLQRTENAQPAIGAFSVGLYKILEQAGFKPDFVAGHSFGELTALWAGGVLSDADYFYLVKARGQAMGTPQNVNDCDSGTMLAVNGDIAKVERIISGMSYLKIANYNSPNQVVLSGSKPEIATLQQILTKQGYSVNLLPVSAAFHTPFVSYASQPFAEALRSVTFNNPKLSVYANTTTEPYPHDPEAIQEILETQMLKSVRFEQEIENIYANGGYYFIEIGPRRILTNLVKNTLGDRPHIAIPLNPSREKDSDLQLRQAVMQLRVAGLPLQNLDPYQHEPILTKTKGTKRMQVPLSGSNYISEKTKAAFEQALQDGYQVKSQVKSIVTEPDSKLLSNLLSEQTDVETHGNGHTHTQVNGTRELITSINATEDQTTPVAQSLPSEMITVSENVTPSPSAPSLVQDTPEHTPDLAQVLSFAEPTDTPDFTPDFTQNFNPVVSIIESEDMLHTTSQTNGNNVQPVVGNSLEALLNQFSHHQSEILRVHEQYLNSQAQCAQIFLQLIQQQSGNLILSKTKQSVQLKPVKAPVQQQQLTPITSTNTQQLPQQQLPKPTPAPAPTPTTTPVVAQFQTTSVTEPTKPVTPVSIPQPQPVVAEVPQQPKVRQISEYIQARTPETVPSPAAPVTPTTTETVSSPEATEATAVSESALAESLLKVVSDKTGYPPEMLELEMDLEADLGIDSIKRVEIMGSVQDIYPELPKVSPEALAEKRTLGEIVEYLESQMSMAKKKIA